MRRIENKDRRSDSFRFNVKSYNQAYVSSWEQPAYETLQIQKISLHRTGYNCLPLMSNGHLEKAIFGMCI